MPLPAGTGAAAAEAAPGLPMRQSASAWGPFGLDTALLDVAALPHMCELHAAICALQAVLGPDPLLSMLGLPYQLEGGPAQEETVERADHQVAGFAILDGHM